MAQSLLLQETRPPWLRAAQARVELHTEEPLQLIDVTAVVAERVRRSGVVLGSVTVQVLHTTAALFVNENEAGLLQDLTAFLQRLVPPGPLYRHDEIDRRAGPVAVDERPNGHAHLQGVLLPATVVLNVVDAELQLGRWQSLFLAELDGPRARQLSIVVLGTGEAQPSAPPQRRARRREELL